MKTLFTIFAALLILSLQTACNDITLGPEPKNNPQTNFELLWQEFDRMYGLFEVKNVDWQAVYAQYRPMVTPATTENELFDIFSQMLGKLNDGHVWLLKPGPDFKRFDSGTTYTEEEFSLAVAKQYLETVKEVRSGNGVNVVYGRFPGNIGYIYFEDLGLQPAFYEKTLDDVLAYLADVKGIIVDARSLEGGEDRSAHQVAGRFASTRKLYMTSRFRNGPKHTDFTSPLEWFVEPAGKSQYTKPIILLTTRITASAGESFTLAMRENSNVIHWGDTTSGLFSDNPRRELPNGWIYTISVGDFRAANGASYEGIGIAPQKLIKNRKGDILAGKDQVLEEALKGF